jgi:hypothetical protein
MTYVGKLGELVLPRTSCFKFHVDRTEKCFRFNDCDMGRALGKQLFYHQWKMDKSDIFSGSKHINTLCGKNQSY